MPAKKAAAAAATTKKTASSASHASYKDMIKDAIVNLKERNGSSRQAIKKYVRANNDIKVTSEAQFDQLFNKALRTGAEKGEFTQPKGTSGPVKLAKKESKPVEKKAAPKETKETKETKPKAATATKKAAPKKTETKTATKAKAPVTKKAASTKAKANTAKPRAKTTKTDGPAPAVQDTPTVLKTTKSGRITKQKAPTTKKPVAKKAAPKKAASKKAEASS